MADQPYANFSGRSGLVSFDLGDDDLWVRLSFRSGAVYEYTPQTHSPAIVATLRTLCLAGSGVCTYLTGTLNQQPDFLPSHPRPATRSGRAIRWGKFP